jgi:hypothetical protein
MAQIEQREGRQQYLEVLVGPEGRPFYLESQLAMDGLDGVIEDPSAAYCALSLTATSEELKPYVNDRQRLLKRILTAAGITPYDTADAPFSPSAGLSIKPEEIYRADLGKVASARFFVAHDILPSTGVGVEMHAAYEYNRIPVIIHDNNIRTSRMQTNRAIHIATDNIFNDAQRILKVFQLLKNYTPGIGFDNGKPALLGFDEQGNCINLERLVSEKFPDLVYEFDGKKPIFTAQTLNPDILIEHR